MPTEIFATFGMLVLMALVFAGAYWLRDFWPGIIKGTGRARQKHSHFRACHGGKRQLTDAGKSEPESLSFGSQCKQITLLETFPADEILNTEEQPPAMISFGDMLKKFREKGSSTND